MQRIPVDSDELYDSSGDEQVTSTSDNPGNLPHYTVGQRLRRTNSLPVNVMMPVGSDQDENSSPDSEEEYIPKSSGESSDSCMSLEVPLQKSSKKKRSLCERNSYLPQKRIHSQSSPQNQLDTTTHLQGEDDTGYQNLEESTTVSQRGSVSVCPVSKKANGLRRYNKMQYCIYCKLGTQKMARHLERKHSEESPVAKLRLLPKNSKERRILLDSLRKRGNFAHNVEVLESGKGKLVPCKQPQVEKKGQDFMHCLYCQGLFLRRILWRHVCVCKFKPENMNSKPGKSRVQTLCAYTQPPSGFSDGYWKLLNKMNHDPISDAIRKDGCILAYGQRLFESKGHQVNHHEYIRQALRELGRLALKLKDVTPLKTTEELFKPTNYIHAVTAVKHTAGFNREAGQYGCPSLARKLGHSLHSMSLWLKSEAQMKGQKETAVEAHEFSELYKQRWTDDITSRALSQLEQAKWNSPHILPFTEDVKTLHCYLDEKQEQLINSMKKQLSSLTWRDLTKVTLAQIILFNRRREGEVSRMPLSAFVLRDTSDPHQDVNLALSTLEQKLCRHFNRIEIRGKRGRKVPLLLTPAMKESIELLVEKREECGVLKENTYLFAVPGSMFNYRGSDCLRQFVKDCNIKNPMSLTSTKLRKHVATLSKVLNLKDTELDQLADFLGHDVRVHRQYYRLPEGTLQLAKMSKILMALEQGRLGEFKGKSLDDIHIDPNEEIEVDEEPEENEESEDECGNKDSTADVNTPMTPKSTQGGNSDKPCEVLSDVNPQKTGRKPFQRRPWQKEEIDAVEKHMKNLILTCQVPGKSDCDRCLKLEPEALKNRDWRAIKFYLKNRITALKKNV